MARGREEGGRESWRLDAELYRSLLSSPSVRDVTDVPYQRGGRVMIRLSFDHETTSSSRPLAIHSIASCDLFRRESSARIRAGHVLLSSTFSREAIGDWSYCSMNFLVASLSLYQRRLLLLERRLLFLFRITYK